MSARTEHEETFRTLVGRTLHGVSYMGAWSQAPTERGAYVEWVELVMDHSERFRLTTEPGFGDYGVVVMEGGVALGSPLKVLDAVAAPPWAAVLGRRLASVKVLWRPLAYEPAAAAGEAPEFPRDVVLSFEGGRVVVLSAAAVGERGEYLLGADSLSALDEQHAQDLGLI